MLVRITADLAHRVRQQSDQLDELLAGRGGLHGATIVDRAAPLALQQLKGRNMPDIEVRGIIPYVFCADAGAVADWCVDVLGFVERERWPDDNGVVRNVELIVGESEVWLDGPVPDWKDNTGGLGAWVGFLVDDVDSIYKHLVGAGVELEPPRTRDHSVREITVEDPEGHSWGFVQRSANA